ncbi:LPXTG cell wall anchor domain-containing protein [Streptococcus suis]|uniref:LPXTG cell wall anchor domain-containing protein n=1 Tax=Streptococcus suis TaxID=1307 RepID=UPI000CF5923D|nr:LPXTG cell wall anchor domain-containing protein [Streptococcus suis]
MTIKRSSQQKRLAKWSKLGLSLAAVTVLGGLVEPVGFKVVGSTEVYANEQIDPALEARKAEIKSMIQSYRDLVGQIKALNPADYTEESWNRNYDGDVRIYLGAQSIAAAYNDDLTFSSLSLDGVDSHKTLNELNATYLFGYQFVENAIPILKQAMADLVPVSKPVETPTDTRPVEPPVEQPVEQPLETPVSTQPSETPVVTPADKPAETLGDPSVSKPAETPSETPANSPAETPTNVQPSADQVGQSATEPTVLSKQDSQAGTASPTGQSEPDKQETKQETKEPAAPASQSKQSTDKPASQTQAKSLPATGEAHSVLHMTGMGLLGLAGLVVKRRSRKSS